MTKEDRFPSAGEIVDSFLEYYDFPRRTDIVELSDRLARLENLLKDILTGGKDSESVKPKVEPAKPAPAKPAKAAKATKASAVKKGKKGKKALSATGAVLQVLAENGGSMSFKEILEKTGFEDKKVRNIVFRLNKLGRIVREDRGTYAFPK